MTRRVALRRRRRRRGLDINGMDSMKSQLGLPTEQVERPNLWCNSPKRHYFRCQSNSLRIHRRVACCPLPRAWAACWRSILSVLEMCQWWLGSVGYYSSLILVALWQRGLKTSHHWHWEKKLLHLEWKLTKTKSAIFIQTLGFDSIRIWLRPTIRA